MNEAASDIIRSSNHVPLFVFNTDTFYYQTFVGAHRYGTEGQKDAFNVDNPTLSMPESDARGPWSSTTLPTGMFSFLLILLMVITSLPPIRRSSYNTFYYTHVISSICLFIVASIHASTDFYFLLPGLLLWVYDWMRRIQTGLRTKISTKLEDAGNGWFRVQLPPLKPNPTDEKLKTNPLETYYLNFPSVSRFQVHALTAAATGSSNAGPTFLFQRATGKKQPSLDKEWTWKLASKASTSNEKDKSLQLDVCPSQNSSPSFPYQQNHK